jgi:hypothetical protein
MTLSNGTPTSEQDTTSWRVEGPQPLGSFVPEGVNDQLVQLCLQLAAELWVTRRRLATIESQLVDAGLVIDPDRLQPPDEPENHTQRDEFIRRIFQSFVR